MALSTRPNAVKLTKTAIRDLPTKAVRYEVSDTEIPSLRVRIATSGIKTFALLYRNAENRRCRYTIGKFGELTPEQAREIAQIKLAEIKLGKDPAAEKQDKRREAARQQYMTLEGFLTHKYGPWIQANQKDGAASLARIRACFGQFMQRQLPELNGWLIESWRKDRLREGRTVSTVNRDINALKAALSRAVQWELIDAHPLTTVKPGKVDNASVVRYLSADEEAQLRRALLDRDEAIRAARISGNEWRAERKQDLMPEIGTYGDHLTPMLLLSINTGLRRGELFNLTWQDVDLERGNLTVRGGGAKSGKTRHIPLNAEALSVLKTWQQQTSKTGLVFKSTDGERFDNIKTAWTALLADAEITGFRWHDLRHHFASRLVMAGVDLNTVRELLGHSDLTMTLRYAHLAPEHKAAAVARLVAAG